MPPKQTHKSSKLPTIKVEVIHQVRVARLQLRMVCKPPMKCLLPTSLHGIWHHLKFQKRRDSLVVTQSWTISKSASRARGKRQQRFGPFASTAFWVGSISRCKRTLAVPGASSAYSARPVSSRRIVLGQNRARQTPGGIQELGSHVQVPRNCCLPQPDIQHLSTTFL